MTDRDDRQQDDKTLAPGASKDSVRIEPVSFRDRGYPTGRKGWLRRFLWVFLLTTALVLSGAIWFVFTAKQVVIDVDPPPEHTTLSGGILAPRVGSTYLLRSGEYLLRAFKECYQPLEERVVVGHEPSQTFHLTMTRIPGRVTLQVHEAENPSEGIDGATIQIDGKEMLSLPFADVPMTPGEKTLVIQAPNYQPLQTTVTIEGCDRPQVFDFPLVPAWAIVTLRSEPPNATVRLDGQEVAQTPTELKVLPGKYQLEISAGGYRPWRTQLEVTSNEPISLDEIRLGAADGTLLLTTNPPGAIVTLAGTYLGKTPIEIPLSPGTTHTLHITKAGYEKVTQHVKVNTLEAKKLTVTMVPVKGAVYLVVEPADAELLVDGRSMGTVPQQMELTAVEHQLEIRKEGYEPFRTTITPSPGFPQEIRVTLTDKATQTAPLPLVRASNGYTLQLIQPGRFTMGSSRREQGRRANETLRDVALEKPFYMGVREVTNREVREFLKQHNSGLFKGQTLNRGELPAVNLPWETAAMFCNWLSAREKLPPVYVKQGERLVAAAPLGTGYRLPTEAEWEFCARAAGTGTLLKYPWGSDFPPPPKSGNYADESAKDILSNYLKGYDDGCPVSAPPAEFAANGLGLVDMGGNVAEWCHDYYSIYPYSAGKVYRDPTGPETGKHHLVKGSSWRHSGISELRCAFRDYSDDKRPDLGFRVCRYVGAQGGARQ